MTDDDKRKQWMSVDKAANQSSDPAQVTDQAAAPSQAAKPDTEAILSDKYGTGFLGGDRYGASTPYFGNSQPIKGGSLFDPTVQTPTNTPATTGGEPVNNPVLPIPHLPGMGGQDNAEPAPGLQPISFRRTRIALGYRGGEY